MSFSTSVLYLALFTPLLNHLAGAPGLPQANVLGLFLPGIGRVLHRDRASHQGHHQLRRNRERVNLPLLLASVLLPISFGPLRMRVLAHFNPMVRPDGS